MRGKLQQFMAGRYGVDQFARFLNLFVIILLVVSMLTRQGILYLFALVLMVYSYFRIFSRNHQKRYAENAKYLKGTAKIRSYFATLGRDMRTRRTHHIYRCPGCRQKIRIPRGKGKIAVRCPKCSTEFIKKS
ncbi:MAG: hypothetical protein K2N63_01545 [Lachnospiraceae bacterium]|nr:hypothetical protein [Lachnospiraceae bacterium]